MKTGIPGFGPIYLEDDEDLVEVKRWATFGGITIELQVQEGTDEKRTDLDKRRKETDRESDLEI